MRRRSRSAFVIAISLAAAAGACSRQSAPLSQPVAAAPASSSDKGYLPLDIAHDDPAVVGSSVHVTATGLPAGKTVELTWGTVTGGWVIEDYYHFRGKKYAETTSPLGRFPIDNAGHLDARFIVPEDY